MFASWSLQSHRKGSDQWLAVKIAPRRREPKRYSSIIAVIKTLSFRHFRRDSTSKEFKKVGLRKLTGLPCSVDDQTKRD